MFALLESRGMRLGVVRSPTLWLTLLVAPLALLGCGGGSAGSATGLLKQTLTGAHRVHSGRLELSLSVRPTGSSTLRWPISLRFGGAFESLGAGRMPKSDFTVSLAGNGSHVRIGLLSTGAAGYVSLGAASYRLPASDYRRLAAGFGSVAVPPGGGGSGALAALGIRPLRWLSHPIVIGKEMVAGAPTTHIRARIDVRALLGELPALLARASALGVSGARTLSSALSPAARTRIANSIRSPTVDVWTGTADRTVRRLQVELTVPVGGTLSVALGGLSSAHVALTMQYAQLNQRQTIVAPAHAQPYRRFGARLHSLVGSLPTGITGG